MMSRRRIDVAVTKGISEALLMLGALRFRSSLWEFLARNFEICDLTFFFLPLRLLVLMAFLQPSLTYWLIVRTAESSFCVWLFDYGFALVERLVWRNYVSDGPYVFFFGEHC